MITCCLFWCIDTINSLKFLSDYSFVSSQMIKYKSKRDMIGGEMLMFFLSDWVLSYRPKIGLAAARMLVLAWRVAWIPAFAMEIVCCYMASWIATWSLMSILSNSSMQQMPLSAKSKAPASIDTFPFSGSLTTEAVRPAALVVLPLVYTLRGTNLSTHLRNWDLAVEGSPTIKMLMSPLKDIFV